MEHSMLSGGEELRLAVDFGVNLQKGGPEFREAARKLVDGCTKHRRLARYVVADGAVRTFVESEDFRVSTACEDGELAVADEALFDHEPSVLEIQTAIKNANGIEPTEGDALRYGREVTVGGDGRDVIFAHFSRPAHDSDNELAVMVFHSEGTTVAISMRRISLNVLMKHYKIVYWRPRK